MLGVADCNSTDAGHIHQFLLLVLHGQHHNFFKVFKLLPERSTKVTARISACVSHTMSIITATRVLADVTSLDTVVAAVTVVLPPRFVAAADAAPSVAAPAAAVARDGFMVSDRMHAHAIPVF